MEQKHELKCKRYATSDYTVVACNEADIKVGYVQEGSIVKCAYVGPPVKCFNELCKVLYDVFEDCDDDVKLALYDVKRELRPAVEDVAVPVTVRRVSRYVAYEAVIEQNVVIAVFRGGNMFSIAKVIAGGDLAAAGAVIAKALHRDLPFEKSVEYAATLLGDPQLRGAIGEKLQKECTKIEVKFPLPPLDVGPRLTPDATALKYDVDEWLERFGVERGEGYTAVKLPMLCRVYKYLLKGGATGYAYLCAANSYSRQPHHYVAEKGGVYLTAEPMRFSMYVDIDEALCVREQDACVETMLEAREKAFRIYPLGLKSGSVTVFEGGGAVAYRLSTHRWDFLYAHLGNAALSAARDNKYATRVVGLTDFLYGLYRVCKDGCGDKPNVVKAAAAGLRISMPALP